MDNISLGVHGLACSLDALVLERRLRRIDGVQSVYVNPANDTAYLSIDAHRVTVDVIRDAVAELGYRAHQLTDGIEAF